MQTGTKKSIKLDYERLNDSLSRLEKIVLDTLDFDEVVQNVVDSLFYELGDLARQTHPPLLLLSVKLTPVVILDCSRRRGLILQFYIQVPNHRVHKISCLQHFEQLHQNQAYLIQFSRASTENHLNAHSPV